MNTFITIKPHLTFWLATIVTILFFSCNEENEELFNGVFSKKGGKATVITKPVTNVTVTYATTGGNLTGSGNSFVSMRGVCWSTSPNPTIELNKKTKDSSGTVDFVSYITGLLGNTTYYVKAYATNHFGTTYGEQVSFKTLYDPYQITDADGNVYYTVTIGNQTWMTENLKTTKYQDGSAIPNITDDKEWANLTSGAYCWYNNDINNKDTYGALYNAYTVSRKICPAGWHVPNFLDWKSLFDYLGANGGKLKATILWNSPNTGANNSSGFTAYPGGYRDFVSGHFSSLGNYGYWWHSSGEWSVELKYNDMWMKDKSEIKTTGASVRCVRDN